MTHQATRDVGTGFSELVRLELDASHRLIGVEVDVSGAGSIRLLSPLGAELWTSTQSGAAKVGTALDAAFPFYRLEVKATSGTISVVASMHAR
jgi:hypothetical protein